MASTRSAVETANAAVKADTEGRLAEALGLYQQAAQLLIDQSSSSSDPDKYRSFIMQYLSRAEAIQTELQVQEQRRPTPPPLPAPAASAASTGSSASSNPFAATRPDPDAMAMLKALGFSDSKAAEALSMFDNDVGRASDWLFETTPAEPAPPTATPVAPVATATPARKPLARPARSVAAPTPPAPSRPPPSPAVGTTPTPAAAPQRGSGDGAQGSRARPAAGRYPVQPAPAPALAPPAGPAAPTPAAPGAVPGNAEGGGLLSGIARLWGGGRGAHAEGASKPPPTDPPLPQQQQPPRQPPRQPARAQPPTQQNGSGLRQRLADSATAAGSAVAQAAAQVPLTGAALEVQRLRETLKSACVSESGSTCVCDLFGEDGALCGTPVATYTQDGQVLEHPTCWRCKYMEAMSGVSFEPSKAQRRVPPLPTRNSGDPADERQRLLKVCEQAGVSTTAVCRQTLYTPTGAACGRPVARIKDDHGNAADASMCWVCKRVEAITSPMLM